ncbi:DNA-binding response regulator [Psychrosphaera saromensis]|jgi:DNA-binding response OmpR family regulator|uniref:DNA-binding response regulator n=1 Tax=Psychrosphaera saromensis TaxID=716813 RepID=A0A2S7UVD2_9GAMM|nr:response regulator [Psychrosphaera saromensis]PQJ53903.1 DNA-binding response regulator [Psychrosphaera saromensis]GHB61483.1 DNA-binding response regulator [Psychrosphaera saromensis]GLQ15293.1 DNA-binding response regulator [Psychrosphaera saromensis]
MRILLVEDDIPLAQGLKHSLHREGYALDWVQFGQLAIDTVNSGDVDLVILDLGLPDMDGLSVLRKLKSLNKLLPVLILTARDGVENKVAGLDLGADDYLAKPFDIAELLARIRVLARRINTHQSSIISIMDVELDVKANLVKFQQQDVEFSRREYMIVKALMESAGRIQSKNQLENSLYEWGEEVSSNTIEVHIHNIRKKLPKEFIKTVRGVGYIVRKS